MKKNHDKRIMLFTVIALAILLCFSLTACSLFSKVVEKVGETVSNELNNLTQDNTTNNQETDTEEGEYGGGSSNSGTVQNTDPIETDYVTITSSLVFDKSGKEDLSIVATHENTSLYGIMGAGIKSSYVGGKSRQGHSDLIINADYLSTLDVGDYDFYFIVMDTDGEKHYNPFTFTVVNTKTKPTDVKINYDVDCPNVYVTYKCDCGTAHTVTFDGAPCELVEEGVAFASASVDKSVSHTAKVSCSNGGFTSITKAAPDKDAVDGKYFDKGYSFLDHSADRYLEDDSEVVDVFQYLIYAGESGSFTCYASSKVFSNMEKGINTYLTALQSSIANPWHVLYSLSYKGRVVTFSVEIQDVSVLSSGFKDDRAFEDDPLITHYTALNTRTASSILPIDNLKKSATVRNVKELLLAVESGYKPNAKGDALTYYDKARKFCYTYLSDDMTDLEKLHVIYDYLAGEINYDDSVLNLYKLVNKACSQSTLAEAKAMINDALADTTSGFSSSMKAAVISARDAATSIDDLYERLKVQYLQRLSAFSIEGVLDNKAAVCEGISYAFMLFARIEGIECYQVTGNATNNNSKVAHAWNKVCLDGKYYCVDATWGNIHINNIKFITHRYFMLSEDVFSAYHDELIGEDIAVKVLAIGDAEYYKNVETSEGHSLYVANDADMDAVVKYYIDAGMKNYFEFACDSAYSVEKVKTAFTTAFRKYTLKLTISYEYSGDGNPYIFYVA